MELLGPLLAALFSIVGAATGFYFNSPNQKGESRAELTLEDRLDQIAGSMRESAALLREVEAELQLRATRAAELKVDADNAERLAQLNAQEREAIASLIRGEIAAEGKRSRRGELVANLLFFFAGVFASIAVTLFVHPL